MQKDGIPNSIAEGLLAGSPGGGETVLRHRRSYDERMQQVRAEFLAGLHRLSAGTAAVHARSEALDALVRALWGEFAGAGAVARTGISLVAVGGYGRGELFPFSDVDLMFLLDAKAAERSVKDAIKRMNQVLWDCGLRVSPMTRTLLECGRFDPENVEFTLALLDARHVAGDEAVTAQLVEKVVPKLIPGERKRIVARLLEVTAARHARYGDTLFHLEPNVKECPGGLRDAHVCAWLARLSGSGADAGGESFDEFAEARAFMLLVRVFLHFRHSRDDNTLDWQTQDEAAAARLGTAQRSIDAAFWMRVYFRHARAIKRRVAQTTEEFAPPAREPALPTLSGLRRALSGSARGGGAGRRVPVSHAGFELRQSRIALDAPSGGGGDPAHDPEVVLAIFSTMAQTGAQLPRTTEARLEDALPILSAHLEDGPGLWRHLQAILTGEYAGRALRSMHALGILELLIPEFHGIDALVIRDAYHRYTVDEHTFVVIDTLHALARQNPAEQPWAARFAPVLRDLPHPELLYLAALLHDTGKGHATSGHAQESARMAESLLARLEVEPYEAGLVLEIIRNHLEMSAALRRDVFDAETVRSFATRVPTPEALRMLTLFTYADIAAVHPDALTPWKAENLWRLFIATSNFLDRNIDEERVASVAETDLGDVMHRVHALVPGKRAEVAEFLEGIPRRYLLTRTPDHIRADIEMAARIGKGGEGADDNQIDFRYAPGLSEVTLITRDRPRLFAAMAGVLAAWGMNIVTADAFSNAHGLVVDSFRFTDTFRTLELNESERVRFVESIRDVMGGRADLEAMLASRRRGRQGSAEGHGGDTDRLRRFRVQPKHAAAGSCAGYAGAPACAGAYAGRAGLQYRSGAGGHGRRDGDRCLLSDGRWRTA